MSSFSNPHDGTPAAEGWRMGFARGFFGPEVCSAPPMVVAPELTDAFNEGTLVGQTAATEGISFSLGVQPEQEDAVKVGIEAGHVGLEVVGEALHIAHLVATGAEITGEVVGATAGGVVLGLTLPVINLLAALEVYAPEPSTVADILGNALAARFGDSGATGPVSIFFVFAITSVSSIEGAAFSSQANAEGAARNLNNGDSYIARLNTENPNSVEVAPMSA
jgi:hypothetical protein